MKKSVMIRRVKNCVLSQLPPKIRTAVELDISGVKLTKEQQKCYKMIKQESVKNGLSVSICVVCV